MARRGVTDFVDTLHDGVERGVVADGRVCPVEVVVDSSGESDNREIEFVGEDTCACERAVTSDDYEGVDS